MAKNKAILIPAILCVLAIGAYISLKSMGHDRFGSTRDEAGSGKTAPPTGESDTRHQSPTKRERQGKSDAKALRELENEFDEILPAQFPQQFSSLCDTTLNPGETLFLGGFRRADGNYEFTAMNANPIKADGSPFEPGETKDSPLQYKVIAKSLTLGPEASSELGLGSLISPAKTRIQKSMVFPPGESPLGADAIAGMMSMPSLVVRSDTAATIYVGNDEQARVISLIANPGDAAGSVRIRTRIESPAVE